VTGYCVDYPDDGTPIPLDATPLPAGMAGLQHGIARLPCGSSSLVTIPLDLMLTNTTAYSAANTRANRISGEFARINVAARWRSTATELGLRIFTKGSCCLDVSCSRFQTMDVSCPFENSTACTHADTGAAIDCACATQSALELRPASCPPQAKSILTCSFGGTRCTGLGTCEAGPTDGSRSSPADAERSAMYSCLSQNRTVVTQAVRRRYQTHLPVCLRSERV